MARWTIYGPAQPQGSTKAFNVPGLRHPVVTSDNPKLKSWRADVVATIRPSLAGVAPLDEPVTLMVSFYVERPKSAPKRITRPATRPDLDKLVRALCDALTVAGVWKDDSRVWRIVAAKAFAAGAEDPEGPSGVPRTVVEVI